MSLSRKAGRTTLFCLPIIFFAAFQIVLLYLYGESIIAVDMFLNLVTTNFNEATELLGNLTIAIITVLVLYVTALALGGTLLWTKSLADASQLKRTRLLGIATTCVGIVLVIGCYIAQSGYSIQRGIFPANVINNMCSAVKRTEVSNDYAMTSAAFDHHAKATHADSIDEVYVLVIGETSRADNWQINGYERSTNPELSKRNDVIFFSKTLSESNTTHKSVPLLLSHLTAETFGDSIHQTKSVISAFKQAGYATAWISNQVHNGSYIDFFSDEADYVSYSIDNGIAPYDKNLVPRFAKFVNDKSKHKQFIVLHTYGSHFNYRERYTPEYSKFKPDTLAKASADNIEQLMNAYNNTIIYTDTFLSEVISVLDKSGKHAALLYLADHGEDIFDDERGRFLHASPNPTYWQIHVPMIVWMSENYRQDFPAKYEATQSNSHKNASSSRTTFDTLLSLAGIQSTYANPANAITEKSYVEPPRMYLNDYNEGVPLKKSGLRSQDFIQLYLKSISSK
jgi:glucan phosphoethanolaminetransferase (alkaline phosphatase superfamily)